MTSFFWFINTQKPGIFEKVSHVSELRVKKGFIEYV